MSSTSKNSITLNCLQVVRTLGGTVRLSQSQVITAKLFFLSRPGRLDRAAARYEEAARLSAKLDTRRSFALERKAVEIYLEQGQPEQALALARRLRSPWAPGFRGIAVKY